MSGIDPEGPVPPISVVLRLSDQCRGLRDCLDSLHAQSIGVERFEVCVSAEGLAEALPEDLQAIRSTLPFRYASGRHSKTSVDSYAGLSVARGRIVFFVSGDEVLDPCCLEEHQRTHKEYPDPHVCVLGYTRLRGEAARSPLMHYLADAGCMPCDHPEASSGSAMDGSAFFGESRSFKRAFLLEQGALDPRLPLGFEWGELGYRLHSNGLKVTRNAAAVTEMARSLSFEDACSHSYRQGRADRVLVQVHPEPEARAWSQIDRAESDWEVVEPIFEDVVKAARELDRFAQERCRFDLPIDELATRLLYRSYAAAFRAHRLLGAVGGVVNGTNP